MATRRRIPCKGRKNKTCRRAKKTCRWASGPKRSFCRKRRTRRH